MENKDGLHTGLRLTGKVLFIVGLTLNVLMLAFGFWPSLFYLLIMLLGIVLFGYKIDFSNAGRLLSGLQKLRLPSFPLPNKNVLKTVLKNILLAVLGIAIGVSMFYFLSQDFFKKRKTYADCIEITGALNDYYKHYQQYPAGIGNTIGSNPLRQTWNKDDWGNNLLYTAGKDGKSYELTSAGMDGKFNTADDIKFSNQ
jgi:general secretion pathway protein G